MAIARTRDPEAVRDRFARWLTATRGGPVEVVGFASPSTGGMSSETFLAQVRSADGPGADDEPEGLVVRLPPDGEGLFPSYDLGRQALVLDALHESTDVPVPRVLAYEPDPEPLGAPFLVMVHVAGRIPADQPSYLGSGWVAELRAEEQRTLQQGFLATLAHVHRVDWAEIGLDELTRPGTGTALERDLHWWRSYLDWAADGAAATRTRAALSWLESNAPIDVPPPGLLWGDVRMPNVVFDDELRPAAVLDWEMADIGPAEVDVGWWLAIHRMSVTVSGADLPGFMDREQALAWYERHLARAVDRDHLLWYEAYGAFRSAAIMVRMARLLHDAGIVDSLDLQERNPCTALLRDVLPA
jgi:aminoglycoside phosphotransferase (APT) family kinase protein